MRISELFYSLQGEGGRAGEASVFIRLSGCSAKHACYSSGVLCDTEFESGKETTLEELERQVFVLLEGTNSPAEVSPWIIWTGGEPLDQLTPEITSYFRVLGFRQALETSGVKKYNPELCIDYITCSPKVAEHVLAKNFEEMGRIQEGVPRIQELRYVRHSGQGVPIPSLKADHYFLSPHFDGWTMNDENVKHCIKLCLENPKWKLSLQLHKLLNIL